VYATREEDTLPRPLTRHHLFGQSRFPQYAKEAWNIKRIPDCWHVAWHTIVRDRSPLAAIEMLYDIFVPQGYEELDPHYEKFQAFLERIRRKP
jgi:hypothetical protein